MLHMITLVFVGICMVVLSILFLKEPLEDKGIEGLPSLALRIFLGVAFWALLAFMKAF